MAFLLLLAIIRVYRILREENLLMLNTKYMTVHASLLFILAGASTIMYLQYFKDGHKSTVDFVIWLGYIFIDFAITCVIAFIMVRVSLPKAKD